METDLKRILRRPTPIFTSTMAFFRQYIAPLLVVLVFTLALVAVSARIFLPDDMLAPAPVSEVASSTAVAIAPVTAPSLLG